MTACRDFRHRWLPLPWCSVFPLSQRRFAAEVWGYVDADGTAHVATEKLDDRYQLFFKGKSTGELSSRAAADPADLAALRETSIYKRMVAPPEHPPLSGIDREKRAGARSRCGARESDDRRRVGVRAGGGVEPKVRWG